MLQRKTRMEIKIVKTREVVARTSLSRVTLWRLAKAGDFLRRCV